MKVNNVHNQISFGIKIISSPEFTNEIVRTNQAEQMVSVLNGIGTKYEHMPLTVELNPKALKSSDSYTKGKRYDYEGGLSWQSVFDAIKCAIKDYINITKIDEAASDIAKRKGIKLKFVVDGDMPKSNAQEIYSITRVISALADKISEHTTPENKGFSYEVHCGQTSLDYPTVVVSDEETNVTSQALPLFYTDKDSIETSLTRAIQEVRVRNQLKALG